MTETNRYENGKIYKLVSPHTNKIYIGSTCKKYLCQRMADHNSRFRKWDLNNNEKCFYPNQNLILQQHHIDLIYHLYIFYYY